MQGLYCIAHANLAAWGGPGCQCFQIKARPSKKKNKQKNKKQLQLGSTVKGYTCMATPCPFCKRGVATWDYIKTGHCVAASVVASFPGLAKLSLYLQYNSSLISRLTHKSLGKRLYTFYITSDKSCVGIEDVPGCRRKTAVVQRKDNIVMLDITACLRTTKTSLFLFPDSPGTNWAWCNSSITIPHARCS